MKFSEDGRELPDSTPIEIPAGFRKPESLKEMIARMIQAHGLRREESDGEETFEEANDFDMEEEESPELYPTHHELHEEVVDAYKAKTRADAEAAADRRGIDGEEEGEGEVDGVQEEAVGSSDRARVQRSSVKKRTPSPERRRARRREEADTTEDFDSD